MARRWWWIMGGAAAAVAGAAAFILNEKSVEQPRYSVAERDGAIELRDYPELLVAETSTTGPRETALNGGFRKLAGYIFAKDRGGESIAMTAPVLNEPIPMTAPVLSDAAAGEWRTRFVMPAGYTRETLPPPGPDVRIDTMPARRVAAIRFSGVAGDTVLTERERELRAWLARRGLAGGAVSYAFYNSPFVPGPLRRNEVLIALA